MIENRAEYEEVWVCDRMWIFEKTSKINKETIGTTILHENANGKKTTGDKGSKFTIKVSVQNDLKRHIDNNVIKQREKRDLTEYES